MKTTDLLIIKLTRNSSCFHKTDFASLNHRQNNTSVSEEQETFMSDTTKL